MCTYPEAILDVLPNRLHTLAPNPVRLARHVPRERHRRSPFVVPSVNNDVHPFDDLHPATLCLQQHTVRGARKEESYRNSCDGDRGEWRGSSCGGGRGKGCGGWRRDSDCSLRRQQRVLSQGVSLREV